MERRDVLKYTALLMGATLSSGAVATILAGCHVNESEDWVPHFLSPSETAFIEELSETMLPRTNTPGAKDALVTRFIDTIRPLRFSTEENESFKSNLVLFIQQSHGDLGKDFIKASNEEKLGWVTKVDTDAYALIRGVETPGTEHRPFYLSLKEQILGAYFSSEKVAKEYFEFDPVPGKYIACIPYSDVGRSWAL